MTELAALEESLTTSLASLRADWPHMLTPTSGGGVASGPSGSPTRADDDSPTEADTPRLERVLSLRREIVDYLAGLALVVVRDRPVSLAVVRCEHTADTPPRQPGACPAGRPYATPGVHAVNWHDLEDLVTFLSVHLRWFTGHELAPTAAEALTSATQRVHALVDPQRRSTVTIGDCPVLITSEAEPKPFACGARVWVTIGSHGARCKGCGTTDTVDGWLTRMVGKPQLVTAEQLVKLLHRRLGVRITRVGVRTWVHRGLIHAAGRDDQGADIFNFREVVQALMRREQLQLGTEDHPNDVCT